MFLYLQNYKHPGKKQNECIIYYLTYYNEMTIKNSVIHKCMNIYFTCKTSKSKLKTSRRITVL